MTTTGTGWTGDAILETLNNPATIGVAGDTGSDKTPNYFFDPKLGLEHLVLKEAVLNLGPIVAGPGGTLWHYVDGVYLAGGEDVTKRRVEQLLGNRFRRTHGQQIVEALQIQEPFISDEQPAEYINCANGLLH